MTGSLLTHCPEENQIHQLQQTPQDAAVLQSGKWVGHFLDQRFGDQNEKWPMDIFIVAKNHKEFWGFGKDDVDVFTIDKGVMQGDHCQFVKTYTTHTINYRGRFNPTGTHVHGQWSFSHWNQGEGEFTINWEPLS